MQKVRINEELRRALTTGAGGVSNVIPEHLEPTLIEYLYKVSPLISLLPKKRSTSKTYEVALRSAGREAWVTGEATTPNFLNSTYDRKAVILKIVNAAGGVSHFAQAASAEFIDLLESEVTAALEGMVDTFEYMNIWGNDADGYQWDGLDTLISANEDSVTDVDATVSLALLDSMLDRIEVYRGVSRHPKVWMMSHQMQSKISGLETRIGMDLETLEYEAGFRLKAYRGIPIIPTPYMRPAAVTTSPTAVVTVAGTGTLPAGEYYYRVASVTLMGEQVAGVADNGTSVGAALTVTITADADAKLYKIYRTPADSATQTDDDYDLIATIAAKTYDSEGALTGSVTTFVDNGSYTASDWLHPLDTGEENIMLVNLDDVRGAQMIYLANQFGNASSLGNWVRYHPLAKTKTSEDFMLESFNTLILPQADICGLARRVSIT